MARIAGEQMIGEARFNTARHSLKIDKTHIALRLLFLIEGKLHYHMKKVTKKKIKRNVKAYEEGNVEADSPSPGGTFQNFNRTNMYKQAVEAQLPDTDNAKIDK